MPADYAGVLVVGHFDLVLERLVHGEDVGAGHEVVGELLVQDGVLVAPGLRLSQQLGVPAGGWICYVCTGPG